MARHLDGRQRQGCFDHLRREVHSEPVAKRFPSCVAGVKHNLENVGDADDWPLQTSGDTAVTVETGTKRAGRS